MKLYTLSPETESIKKHFEDMARGRLNQAEKKGGWGTLGSRRHGAGVTTMSGGSGIKEKAGAVLQMVSPTEIGIQLARSQISAEKAAGKKNGFMSVKNAGQRLPAAAAAAAELKK